MFRQLFGALHTSYSSSEMRTQQATVCSLPVPGDALQRVANGRVTVRGGASLTRRRFP